VGQNQRNPGRSPAKKNYFDIEKWKNTVIWDMHSQKK
jgi:hypothetical protein